METVYILMDEEGGVIDVNSSAFLLEPSGYAAVCTGEGDRYAHAQGNFFLKPIRDERGICRYQAAPAGGDLPDAGRVMLRFIHEGAEHILYERTAEEMDAHAQPSKAALSDTQRIAALEEELKAAKILLGLEE